MLAEAADRAGAESVAAAADVVAPGCSGPGPGGHAAKPTCPPPTWRIPEFGCPVAALGSEMPRQAPGVRRAATRRIKEMVDLVARQSPDWGTPGAHEKALVTVATLVGAVMLARAVDETGLSEAIRQAALAHLLPAQQ